MIREMQIRNYSPRSIKTYVSLLSNLAKFYNLSPDQITVDQFKDFLQHRITIDKVSTSSINQTIGAFKILHVDVLDHDWEQIKIKRPRREMKLPVVLSTGEVASMIAATKNVKHRALLALAYSSGVRREELRTLKPENIDPERMRVHVVQGKGKKARYTLLSQKALDLLRIYYRFEKPTCFLFETSLKKGKSLAVETINQIAKNAARKAGVKKKISFHTLRHSFATHLLEKGVNLRIIQQFLGHNSLKTTSVYLHIANIDISRISSPLEDMDI